MAGDTAADCPRCGEPTTAIGHEHMVVAVFCDDCQLVVSLTAEVAALDE